MRPIARKRLEQQLRKRYGAGQVTRWDSAEDSGSRDTTQDHAKLADLMSDIADKARLLTRRGLDVLVIDTVSALPERKLPKFAADLKRLWRSGVEIVLCIEDQTIFFDDMKDLVTTSEFIDIYMKSMWISHIGKEPCQVAKYRATSFRQGAEQAC
jgi:methionine synthase I (cobalamin-dependent)